MDSIEIGLDHLVTKLILVMTLGFCVASMLIDPNIYTVMGFAIAAALWVLSMLFLEKPTKLAADMLEMQKKIAEMNVVVQANAEYSAKEFGTLKNVLQIKQMGR